MDSDDDFTKSSVSARATRRTYLITCSQVDKIKFPSRESFGNAVVGAFNNATGKVFVEYWACCLESHVKGGEHYHLCVKLSGPRRWKPIKQKVAEEHGAILHFSSSHDMYDTAFKYVCKSDKDVFLSPNHPNLMEIGSPKTKKCVKVFRDKARKRKSDESESKSETNDVVRKDETGSKNKIRRLSNLEVSEFLVKNNVKHTNELFALAKERQSAGNKDLANYVLSRSSKKIDELLENTWRMEGAKEQLERANTPRMDILRKASQEECVPQCQGQWFECAYEVLTKNNIHPYVFAAAVRDLIEHGRGKFRNIMIIGPANCAKTFMLSPLQSIFKTFSNPANDKYAWIGAEDSECIFLNDFRWCSELIAWKEFLLLLEGQEVHLPSPKNHYSKDIVIKHDVPIFATGKGKITYVGRYQTTDERETEMMSVRWKYFEFKYQIPQHEQKDILPCRKCFARLAFVGEL